MNHSPLQECSHTAGMKSFSALLYGTFHDIAPWQKSSLICLICITMGMVVLPTVFIPNEIVSHDPYSRSTSKTLVSGVNVTSVQRETGRLILFIYKLESRTSNLDPNNAGGRLCAHH